MKQYLDLLQDILDTGVKKAPAREGMPSTLEIFGKSLRFDLQEGFPLLTTKKMFFKGVKAELLWFLNGKTNIEWLWKKGNCHIWDKDAFKYFKRLNPDLAEMPFRDFEQGVLQGRKIGNYTYGDCGKIYGYQWTNWETKFDQISNLIISLKENPDSRYHLVTAWNPQDFIADKQAASLPACHMMFQCIVQNGKLNTIWYQRSVDTFLGLPFNIASYALLTHILAKECDLQPGELVFMGGSVHVYENHLDAVKEQLSRTPKRLPSISISKKPFEASDKFPYYKFALDMEDIKLENYDSYDAIKAELSVGV